jgi:hypothetical protein
VLEVQDTGANGEARITVAAKSPWTVRLGTALTVGALAFLAFGFVRLVRRRPGPGGA